MFHPLYWANRLPTSLFEQTLYETDQMFYATFPAARDAAILEENVYDPTSSTDCSISHDGVQSLDLESHHHAVPDISTSLLFSDVTRLHFDYSQKIHFQQAFSSRHQDQPSYCPPPVENDASVYIPSEQPYYHQYPFESTSYTAQSSSGSVSAREPTPFQSNTGNVNTDLRETVNDGCPPDSPKHDFCQLNRHMKPPTLKFTNNCQLAVMRLDRLSEPSRLHSSRSGGQSYASSSKSSQGQVAPTLTEFLLTSPKSPSIGLSSLPSKNVPEKKPPLACLFCRGRKIACGPPLPGSTKKTCNQCRKRSLQCHYPSESRRGMRKKKTPSNNTDTAAKT